MKGHTMSKTQQALALRELFMRTPDEYLESIFGESVSVEMIFTPDGVSTVVEGYQCGH